MTWGDAGASGTPADFARFARPALGLLAQAQAQTRPRRDQHAAVLDVKAFVEQRLKPVEMLDPWLGRVDRAEVDVQLHREMRAEPEARIFGQAGDLQEGRDAADA